MEQFMAFSTILIFRIANFLPTLKGRGLAFSLSLFEELEMESAASMGLFLFT
jgi:hypothetical protein